MYYALIARQFKVDSAASGKVSAVSGRKAGRGPKLERSQTMRPEA